MRVICPYSKINPIVHAWLKRTWDDNDCSQPRSVEFHPMYRDDDYWKLLSELWERQEDSVIIEHDVMPWPGCIQELFDCPYPWCSNTYEMRGGYGIYHSFGCAKFNHKFMEMFPDVWTKFDDTKWNTLDAQFSTLMLAENFTPHPHRPPVIHLKGLDL